jgi:hypothetical protein
VFLQARFHTHHPLVELVDFLTSPGGSLLWDNFLLALGIYVTVVILQRYFDRQEEKRWRPARQYMYHQLFSDADWLLGLLPSDLREQRPKVAYRFGSRDAINYRHERDFGSTLTRLRAARLRDVTEQFANNPNLLDGFKRSLDTSLGYTGAVFLAREPELNKILSELQEWMLNFEDNLKGYRGARGSGVAGAGSIAFDQACVSLKQMIVMGYQLRTWLLEQATEIEPSNPRPA